MLTTTEPTADQERVGAFLLDRRKDGSLDFSLPSGEFPAQFFVRLIPGIIMGLIVASRMPDEVFKQLLCGITPVIVFGPVALWSFTIRRGFTIGKNGLEIRNFDRFRFSTIKIPAAELTECTYRIEKGSRSLVYIAHFCICSTDRMFEVFDYKNTSESKAEEVVQNWLKLLEPFFPKHR